MIIEHWREIQAKREAESPGTKFLFIEMRRPRTGIVIFEAPEYGVTRQYNGQNFVPLFKEFIDREVSPLIPPGGPGMVDVILVDPGWADSPLVPKADASS